jgi:hypothetical protein
MGKGKTHPFATALAKKELSPGRTWRLLSSMGLNSPRNSTKSSSVSVSQVTSLLQALLYKWLRVLQTVPTSCSL